ncbi:hypothetical protein MMC20_006817 [Loxospora ochrophaea]|nr:hypothetical protein [Loxospora ochrophaea]
MPRPSFLWYCGWFSSAIDLHQKDLDSPTPKYELASSARCLVYHPNCQTIEIKSERDMANESKSFLSCRLPPRPGKFCVFVNDTNNPDKMNLFALAVGAANKQDKKILLGRLCMDELGLATRVSRYFGDFRNLYVDISEQG